VASLRASLRPAIGCGSAFGSSALISFSSRSGCSRKVVLGSEKAPPVGAGSSAGGGSSVQHSPTTLATRRVRRDAARRPERGKGASGRTPPGSGEARKGRSPYWKSRNKVAESDAGGAVFLHADCRLSERPAPTRAARSRGAARDPRGPPESPVTGHRVAPRGEKPFDGVHIFVKETFSRSRSGGETWARKR
jgi:hypothetical protein